MFARAGDNGRSRSEHNKKRAFHRFAFPFSFVIIAMTVQYLRFVAIYFI